LRRVIKSGMNMLALKTMHRVFSLTTWNASDAPWRAPSSRLADTRRSHPLPFVQDVGPYSVQVS
jgi:hypothetical protein